MPQLRLNQDYYPLYSADGKSLGPRSREAVECWIDSGRVRPVYGRKGHLKAIFLPKEDGAHPVSASVGTKYSYQQRLDNGLRCWKLKELDLKDEHGVPFSTEAIYRKVLLDCFTT